MSTRKQIVYSIVILVLAGVGLGFYNAWAAPADQSGGTDGHNHAAMGGGEGDELNPVQLTEREARIIGVTFATVERKPLDRRVRSVGNVAKKVVKSYDVAPLNTPPSRAIAFSAVPLGKAGVPLKSMCSTQWEIPVVPRCSLRLPTRYQIQKLATGAAWASCTRTDRPLDSSVWTKRPFERLEPVITLTPRVCCWA